MRVIAAAAFWLSMTLAAAATPVPMGTPPTPAQVFRTYGLFGTWAVDCGRPASPQNPYVRDFLNDAGAVAEEHHFGADYAVNHYDVLSAKRLSATEVELDVTYEPGDEAVHRQTLVMRVADGRRRTLFNQPVGGKVRVKGGLVLGLGVKTQTLVKCE